METEKNLTKLQQKLTIEKCKDFNVIVKPYSEINNNTLLCCTCLRKFIEILKHINC